MTNFAWIGPPSFPWLFKMIWLLTYGQVLENQVFQFDPAGYLYMLLFGMLGELGVIAIANAARVWWWGWEKGPPKGYHGWATEAKRRRAGQLAGYCALRLPAG